MATVSGTSLEHGATVTVRRHDRVRRVAIACALGICLAYLELPGRLVFVREELLYVGGEAATVAAILIGVRWYRPPAAAPWYVLAAGLASWTIADLIRGIYVLNGDSPFPSFADPFYLVGYALLALGFALAARRRFAEFDFGAILDSVILTASIGLVVWVYMIEPLRSSSDTSPFATSISVVYPLGDLLLLAVVSRFLIGDSWKLPVFRWLAIGLVLILVGDMSSTLIEIGHTAISKHAANTLILGGVLLFGIAALDSSMGQLTEPHYAAAKMPSLTRLMLIALATLLPSAIRIAQVIRGKPVYLPMTIAATLVIFAAALLRWSGILTELKRVIGREAQLRRYASKLLETSGRDELEALAEQTAQGLVHEGRAELRHVVEGTSSDPHHVTAEIVVRGEPEGELVATASSTEIARVREALPAVANQLALALEREMLLETERQATEQLADQNEQLRELDKLKDEFVSMVSHELRTPLTSMVGYLEVLLTGEVGELNDEQRHFLEIVNRSSARLNRLIDDILFISRVDSGRLSLAPSWVSLPEIADRCVETARFAAQNKGIELVLSAEDGLPTLWGDPIRLTQMFDNLISNAIKFTSDDGTISLSVSLRGETLHVEIADSGVGIPEDEVGKLFERFFRASTGVTAPGTGLGLSIVQSIVQVHGGKIDVKSTLGVGTTFMADLPLPGIPGAPERDATEVVR